MQVELQWQLDAVSEQQLVGGGGFGGGLLRVATVGPNPCAGNPRPNPSPRPNP